MGQTLENGVYLPSEGERNCYAGLKTNWEILDQKIADVTALQQAVAGALHRQIVASLPTTDIDPNTIYMILSGTSATENVYNEFMYVNNAWELIGTSATDLTNYYTKAEVDGKLLLKANASDLTSHTGDTTIHVTTADKATWNTVTSKANDSDVVHTSGDESVIGSKRFGVVQSFTGYPSIKLYSTEDDITVLPSSVQQRDIRFTDKNNAIMAYFIFQHRNDVDEPFRTCWRQNKLDGTSGYYSVNFNNLGEFYPENVNTINLGTPTCRWKGVYATNYYYGSNNVEFSTKFVTTDTAQTISGNKTFSSINGVEPSSLSLPDLNNGIDISSYIPALVSGNTQGSYTPSVNGFIAFKGIGNGCSIVQGNIGNNVSYVTDPQSNKIVNNFLPVIKDNPVVITARGLTSIEFIYFYPCQGNV